MSAPFPNILERIRTGEIAASDALDRVTIAGLEHPDDPAARDKFGRHLDRAIYLKTITAEERFIERPALETVVEARPLATGSPSLYTPLPIRQQVVSRLRRTPVVRRADYHAWRAQCPQELLSAMTLIDQWLVEKPKKPKSDPVPASVIASLVASGKSIPAVVEITSASPYRVKQIRKKNRLPSARPGPKPKIE